MPPFVDSLSDSSERSVEWKYTGHFLQMGILHYTQPETHKQLVIGWRASDILRNTSV